MAYSKSKPAFGIDQILTETQLPPSLIVSSPAQVSDLATRIPSYGHGYHEPIFDPYTINLHPASYFPASIPPTYFPPAYHHVTDQYPMSTVQKGITDNNEFIYFLLIVQRCLVFSQSSIKSNFVARLSIELGKEKKLLTKSGRSVNSLATV